VVGQAAKAAGDRYAASLKQAQDAYVASLHQTEETHKATLKQAEESYRSMLQMTSTIDLDLRKERAALYADLWKKTGVLPKWPPDTSVTYEGVLRFSEGLREWYFAGGGMYFSTEARETYGKLQDRIRNVLKAAAGQSVPTSQPLSETDYEAIRSACSALRTEMTNDLLSRRAAPLGQ
jgi:hypothetical protein